MRYIADVEWTPAKIRQRRDELGLTQPQLAERTGVTTRTVAAWEAGESKPRRTSNLDRVLGSPPNGTGDRFDLSGMELDQLIALQAAAAAAIATRAAAARESAADETRLPQMRKAPPGSEPVLPELRWENEA